MALASPDMYLFALTVDIAHLQRQGLSEAQAHRIGCQQKDPVAQPECGTDQLLNLGDGDNIRKRLYFGGFYYIYPLPVALKDMLPEELQAITVNLDGTPRMRLNQLGKIIFSLFQGQLIGAAIKMFTDPTHSPRVGINGFLTFTLKLDGFVKTPAGKNADFSRVTRSQTKNMKEIDASIRRNAPRACIDSHINQYK